MGEQEHRIDMKSIEPYKRVISHGGIQTQMMKFHANSPARLIDLR